MDFDIAQSVLSEMILTDLKNAFSNFYRNPGINAMGNDVVEMLEVLLADLQKPEQVYKRAEPVSKTRKK